MSKVNIGGDPNDPCYRYKREVIQIEKVNKGLWKIGNIKNICKQLQVKDDFLNKFYSEIKRTGLPMIGVGQFKGIMGISDLEKILNRLIDQYILCSKCKLPEWTGEVCLACGFTKATKITSKIVEEDEKVCLHMKEAVVRAHALYKLRDETDEKVDIEEIIEHFWTLTDCANDRTSENNCAKRYKLFCKQYDTWIASYKPVV